MFKRIKALVTFIPAAALLVLAPMVVDAQQAGKVYRIATVTTPALTANTDFSRLESVRKVYVFKHSFLSIRRIDAMRRKARAVLVRFSKSFARRRHLPSQAKVLSTTHLLGMTSKPVAVSDRLTISVSRLGKIFFCACSNIGPWYPPSAKSFFRNGNLPNKVPRTRMPPSRSWILAGWTTA